MISHFHYQHGKELVLNIQRKKENSQMGGKKKDAEQPQRTATGCKASLCETWTWRNISAKILLPIYQDVTQRREWSYG